MKSVTDLITIGGLQQTTIKLYAFLQDNPETSTKEMMEYMQVAKHRISQHLRMLRENRLIMLSREGSKIRIKFI